MATRAEFYQQTVYPILSRFDAEKVHNGTLRLLEALESAPVNRNLLHEFGCVEGERFTDPRLEVKVGGIQLENPLLLAAGFDKNGRCARAMYELGFSSVEVGSVTLFPQPGQEKPRVFRLKPESLLNHLGFPSAGVAEVYKNLDKYHGTFPLGVSLGVNVATGLEQAAHDMAIMAHLLSHRADYLVINLSSPNTENLRSWLYPKFLHNVLAGIRGVSLPLPIWLKLSPDMTHYQLDQVLRFALDEKIAGLIATNTTSDYSLLPEDETFIPTRGGLSGQVLRDKATEVVRHLYRESGGAIDIVGCGGVDSLEAALEKFAAGAKAVSAYTALVYKGPTFPSALNRSLVDWLERHGATMSDIVGQQL